MDIKKTNTKDVPKKVYVVRTTTKIGTKNKKEVKRGSKVSLTDAEARNYKQNNII